MKKLKAFVLSIAGERVIGTHLDAFGPAIGPWLLKKGKIFKLPRRNVVVHSCCPNRCHDNAPFLAAEMPGLQVWTGLAYTKQDKTWRAHSWCVDPSFGVIETTVRFDIYFGAKWPKRIWNEWVPRGEWREKYLQEWAVKEGLNETLSAVLPR